MVHAIEFPIAVVEGDIYIAAVALIAPLAIALLHYQWPALKGASTVLAFVGLAVVLFGFLAAAYAAVITTKSPPQEPTWVVDILVISALGVLTAVLFGAAAGKITGNFRLRAFSGVVLASIFLAAIILWTASTRGLPGERIAVPQYPRALAAGQRNIWIAHRDGLVSRVDPDSRSMVGRPTRLPIAEDAELFHVAVGFDAVWVTDTSGKLWKLREDTGQLLTAEPIQLGNGPGEIAIGEQKVWLNNHLAGDLVQVDPDSHKVRRQSFKEVLRAADVALGQQHVWLTDDMRDQVAKVTAGRRPQVVEVTPVTGDPNDILVTEDGVWVTYYTARRLASVQPGRPPAVRTAPIGYQPSGLAAFGGSIWVTNYAENTAVEVAAGGMERKGSIDVAVGPSDIASGFGALWITSFDAAKLTRYVP